MDRNSNPITNISPIDGRYSNITNCLNIYFSEYSFIRYRILIEIKYLIALSKIDIVDDLEDSDITYLKSISKF